MSEQRTVLPADFIERRTGLANALGKAALPLDNETIQTALLSSAIDNLLFVKRLGEMQAQLDRIDGQLASLQRGARSVMPHNH